MTELTTGALERWLTPDPDQPLNGVAVQRADVVADAVDAGPADELVKMRTELALLRGKADLQRDPAWLDVLSDDEAGREREAAEKIRGMRRRQQVSAATAAVRLSGRERRAEQQLARIELSDRLWVRRALARRTRLLDATSRLASLQRTHVFSSVALIGLAVAGIAWTSVGVHDTLVGPDGSPLAYVVEPLFSVPLLVIMMLHARAAQWGRTFPARTHRRKVYVLEAALLFASVLLNSASVLPVLGTWKDTTTLLAHLAPPVLILVAVVLQPLTASFLAGILADAHVDAADAGSSRMSVDTVNTLAMVVKIREAIAAGELELWENTGLPSIKKVGEYFGCEKKKAQAAIDAMRMLDGPDAAADDGPGVWR